MTKVILVRHAVNDFLPKGIAGRKPGVHLNAEGKRQAESLAEHLARLPIAAIFSSPLERARETAEPLARRLGQHVEFAPELLEVDFGDWTGKSLQELDAIPLWEHWNSFRSCTQIPNGEP